MATENLVTTTQLRLYLIAELVQALACQAGVIPQGMRVGSTPAKIIGQGHRLAPLSIFFVFFS